MLYFAYGSNLNIKQMKYRCPKAVALGNFYLRDARLIFRGVADCIYLPGAICPGGIWSITKDCERALDRYEGFHEDDLEGSMYRKQILKIRNADDEVSMEVMIYRMNSTGIFPPSQSYLDTIAEGYRNFKLPLKRLRQAVKRSYDNKAPSSVEIERRKRTKYPKLARIG